MGNEIKTDVPGYLCVGEHPTLGKMDTVVWRFAFDTGNPFEIRLTCHSPIPRQSGGEGGYFSEWVFDRSLLKAAVVIVPLGSRTPVVFGEGDVRVGRVPSGVAFRLKIHHVTLWGVAAVDALNDFMSLVDSTVKPGTETYDVDAWLQQMGLNP